MPERIQRRRGNRWKAGDLGQQEAVDLFEMDLTEGLETGRISPDFLAPLRGAKKSCLCKAGDACYADVLISFANALEV